MTTLLPNADNAHIDPRKLRDYVLNFGHDLGQYKAAFFAQMGYTADKWQQLEYDIREQHLHSLAEEGKFSKYGRKYTITAPLQGPNSEQRWVTTVWIIRTGNDHADLVTIEPAQRQKVNDDG